jgi:uncharacterized repeat protein (TIGR02543 family)
VDSGANLGGSGNVIAAFSTKDDDTGDFMFLSARTGYQGLSLKPETGARVDIRGGYFGKGAWVHVAYTQKGKTGTANGVLYVNGAAVQTGAVTATPAEFGLSYYNWIGKSISSGEGLLKNTRIADFRIYHYAMDTEEIASLAARRDDMPVRHTVTFDPGADGTVNPHTMETPGFGQILGSVPIPSDSGGRAFDGWYTEHGGGGSLFNGATMVTGDITVYAHWGAPEDYWKIDFDANRGGDVEDPASIMVYKGGKIGSGVLPILAGSYGYVFTGWWTDATSGSEIDAETIPTEDMTVHAHWIDPSMMCEISFDANEGGINGDLGDPDPISVIKNTAIGSVLPWEKGVTQNGKYAFAGWFDTAAGSGGEEYTAASTAPNDAAMALHARWNYMYCDVSFDTQSGGEVANPGAVSVEKNTVIGTLPEIGRAHV